jgi:hypothetical protein
MNFIRKFYSELTSIAEEEIEESSISSNEEDSNFEKGVANPNETEEPIPQQVFPLLDSLGVNKTFHINGLTQEIVKLKSDMVSSSTPRRRVLPDICYMLLPLNALADAT